METHTLLLQIAIVLLSARLFAEVAVYFGIPPIIGEIFAGIIIGPSLLGWVDPSDAFRLLAEIGIILLLFEVGLETDIQRLAEAGPSRSTESCVWTRAPRPCWWQLADLFCHSSWVAVPHTTCSTFQ